MNRKAILALFSFALILCAAAFFRMSGSPRQLSCSACETLLEAHKDSFESIAKIAGSYLSQHDTFHASFDENGALDLDDPLRGNEALISALNEIRSDQMLSHNPFGITAGTRMDKSISIRFYLYENRSTYSGIEYREVDDYAWPEEYERRICAHWFFYSYPKI